jgi:hypothetical protein
MRFMQQHSQTGSEYLRSIKARRMVLLSVLVVVSLLIWALWELARSPFGSHRDLSISFGGSELTVVFTLITVLAMVWVVGAVRLVLTFVQRDK